MTIPQEKFRELVFQMLYSSETGSGKEEDVQELLMKELAVTRKTVHSAQERVNQIRAILKELDTMIAHASFSYSFERIQTVEKNILRLGLFEMFFDDKIPPKVAISEAMRLARKFGTKESAGFINAVMDTLFKIQKGEAVDLEAMDDKIQKLIESEEAAKNASNKPKETEK